MQLNCKRFYIFILWISCCQIWGIKLARAHEQSCKIVTSFSILQDIVINITGHRCTVETIVGPNEDAHVFEPKPANHKLITSADAVIINGLGFESWMERLLNAAQYQGPIIVASAHIQPIYVHLPDTANAVPDPHAWHTIAHGIAYVNEITKHLCQIFPEFAQDFQRNSENYKTELKLLDQMIDAEIAAIPLSKRYVITAHDAFGYLSRHYGIKFMSPLGMSTDSNPSAKHVAHLIDQIKKTKIKAIFIENIANDKLIKQLIDETGITISGKLYSDALSRVDEPASTYIKMIHHNMHALTKAMAHNGS